MQVQAIFNYFVITAPNPLREYINREMEFHTEELNCSSAAELPKYKGFKVISVSDVLGHVVF